jgi:hypothetical protein
MRSSALEKGEDDVLRDEGSHGKGSSQGSRKWGMSYSWN